MTKNEIKAKLDELDVDYDASLLKDDLQIILKEAMNKKDESSDDELPDDEGQKKPSNLKPDYSNIFFAGGYYVCRGERFSTAKLAAIYNAKMNEKR